MLTKHKSNTHTLFADQPMQSSQTKSIPAQPSKNKTKQAKASLNHLNGKDWIKFTKSWFILPSGATDRKKTEFHPATFPQTLAADFISFFTKEDETVLDPFAGTGTTLSAANVMGRQAKGIELESKFVDFARSRTFSPVVHGEALETLQDTVEFPDQHYDYIFTSPPYWNMLHKSRGGNGDTRHKKRKAAEQSIIYGDNPNDLGNIEDPEKYIQRLIDIFTAAHRTLKGQRYCTVIIQNMNYQGNLVPIAWNFAAAMSNTGLWELKGERIWCKDQGTLGIYGYPTTYATNNVHHYCLTFRSKKFGGDPC